MKKILGCFFAVLIAVTVTAVSCNNGTGGTGKDNTPESEKTFEQLLAENNTLVFKGESNFENEEENGVVKYKFQCKPFTLTIEPSTKRAAAEIFYVKEDGSPVPQEDFNHLNGDNREVWDGVYKIEDGYFVWEIKKTIVTGGKAYEKKNWIDKYAYTYKDKELILDEKFSLSWDWDTNGYTFQPPIESHIYTLKRQ